MFGLMLAYSCHANHDFSNGGDTEQQVLDVLCNEIISRTTTLQTCR
jgi:hypothetical protein